MKNINALGTVRVCRKQNPILCSRVPNIACYSAFLIPLSKLISLTFSSRFAKRVPYQINTQHRSLDTLACAIPLRVI